MRSKPGRLDISVSKRSRILSCSDILAFFNLVGIQGKRLFNEVLPIYIGTIVLDCDSEMK
jgi:hypothetical protein